MSRRHSVERRATARGVHVAVLVVVDSDANLDAVDDLIASAAHKATHEARRRLAADEDSAQLALWSDG